MVNVFKELSKIIADYNMQGIKYKIGKFRRCILFAHCVYCKLTLHCNHEEYFAYEFYKLNCKERKKFLLVYHQRQKYRLVNAKGATSSKVVMAQINPVEYGREFLNFKTCDYDTFHAFFEKHKKIIVKPDCDSYGRRIKVLNYKDEVECLYIFSFFTNKDFMCEEYIKQHSLLNSLNPKSVNTVRILALLVDGDTQIIAAALRSGSGDSVVDNLKKGGIGANVNIETGVVDTIGMDYNGKSYTTHPNTGYPFLGLKIPFWEEAIQMVKQAHIRFQTCAILGWDIAITEERPVIIEANNAPGPMIHQFIDKVPKGEKIISFLKAKEKERKRR